MLAVEAPVLSSAKRYRAQHRPEGLGAALGRGDGCDPPPPAATNSPAGATTASGAGGAENDDGGVSEKEPFFEGNLSEKEPPGVEGARPMLQRGDVSSAIVSVTSFTGRRDGRWIARPGGRGGR